MKFAVAILILSMAILAGGAQSAIELKASADRVGQYEKIEFAIAIDKTFANPYDPEQADIVVVLPVLTAKSLSFPAFWCQDFERIATGDGKGGSAFYPLNTGSWKARFAAAKPGKYSAVAQWNNTAAAIPTNSVEFEVTPSADPGFVGVHKTDPRFFQFSNGDFLFPDRPECGVHRRGPVCQPQQGRPNLQGHGRQRGQLRPRLAVLRGLGDGHRGPQKCIRPFLVTPAESIRTNSRGHLRPQMRPLRRLGQADSDHRSLASGDAPAQHRISPDRPVPQRQALNGADPFRLARTRPSPSIRPLGGSNLDHRFTTQSGDRSLGRITLTAQDDSDGLARWPVAQGSGRRAGAIVGGRRQPPGAGRV